jgi:U3 small nucleolar RNA-associated protein 3
VASSRAAASDSDDEVDAFHNERQQVNLNVGDDVSDSDDDEAVFGVAGDDGSDDDEDDDDDSDDDEEDQAIKSMTSQWGKNKKAFHGADVTELELDDDENEQAKLEEQAALELQSSQLGQMEEDDFDDDLDDDSEDEEDGKKGKGRSKSQDDGLLEAMNDDLSDIQFSKSGSVAVEKVSKKLTHLSKDEKLEIVMTDAPELIGLLEEFKDKIKEMREGVKPIIENVQAKQSMTNKGLSFLEIKHQLLLSYCINISFYLLLKSQGKPVRDHPVMVQLLEIRTLLERLRPLDSKLKYQIDKLLKAAARGSLGSDGKDPLQYKPNPGAMMAKDDDDDDDNNEEESSGIYHAPRLSSTPFELEEHEKTETDKKADKLKKRKSKSILLKELKEELSEGPREIREAGERDEEIDAMEKEQLDFEEERFIRLTTSKKDKQKKKRLSADSGRLETVTNLGDFGDLEDLLRADDSSSSRKEASKQKRFSSLQQTLHTIQQKSTKSSSQIGGDADVPFKDQREIKIRPSKREYEPPQEPEHSRAPVEEDEFYKSVMNDAADKRQSKKSRADDLEEATHNETVEDGEDGDKRGANWTMMTNKGLTVQKKKINRNPRVKKREAYRKAVIRRKGQVRELRTGEADQYGGETTGIRSDVTRGRKMNT